MSRVAGKQGATAIDLLLPDSSWWSVSLEFLPGPQVLEGPRNGPQRTTTALGGPADHSLNA